MSLGASAEVNRDIVHRQQARDKVQADIKDRSARRAVAISEPTDARTAIRYQRQTTTRQPQEEAQQTAQQRDHQIEQQRRRELAQLRRRKQARKQQKDEGYEY